MKDDLFKMVHSLMQNDREKAKEHLSVHLNRVSSSLLNPSVKSEEPQQQTATQTADGSTN